MSRLALIGAVLATAIAAAEPEANTADAVGTSRGEYLARIGGCIGCHSTPDSADLAGGPAIETPFGRFFPPNLTPDPDTGLGRWSDADFIRAMQQGIAPDGRRYYPVFPYTSYQRMRRDDVLAIKQFLDRVPARVQRRRAHEPTGLARADSLLSVWQWLYLKPEWSALPDTADAMLREGAYLVEAVAHCGECHTPRDVLGGSRHRDWLRGARLASGHRAGNLTPHADGLSAWTEAELVTFLQTGRDPFDEKTRHEMREVVVTSSRYLSEPDRRAIARYLLALPARADAGCQAPHGPRPSVCR